MPTIQQCCTKLTQEMTQLQNRANAALQLPSLPASATAAHPDFVEAEQITSDLTDKPAGAWIDVHGTKVPSLAGLLSHVRTPLNSGFSQWDWYNNTTSTKTSLTLPQAPNAAKMKVILNGSTLDAPGDYSIAGAVLTFVHPLDPKDWVFVKTFGG